MALVPYPPHEDAGAEAMGLDKGWVMGTAAIGSVATLAAAVLLWFLWTRPAALAALLVGGFPS